MWSELARPGASSMSFASSEPSSHIELEIC